MSLTLLVGDRAVGKTETIRTLVYQGENIKLIEPQPRDLFPETATLATTGLNFLVENLTFEVTLSRGLKQISVDWIDTGGEVWETDDQDLLPEIQKTRQERLKEATAIVLLVPPYRKGGQNGQNQEQFMTQKQWEGHLRWWLDLFKKHCSKVPHILICLHRADEMGNRYEEVAKKHRYNPNDDRYHAEEYQEYIRNKFFSHVQPLIREYNAQAGSRTLNFFLTTTKELNLLELPWIHLASYFEDNSFY